MHPSSGGTWRRGWNWPEKSAWLQAPTKACGEYNSLINRRRGDRCQGALVRLSSTVPVAVMGLNQSNPWNRTKSVSTVWSTASWAGREHGLHFQVVGQFVEANGIQSSPQAERPGLEDKGPALGGCGSLAQPRTDGGIQRLFESTPRTVHGLAQQPLDIFVQSHRGSHDSIMMP